MEKTKKWALSLVIAVLGVFVLIVFYPKTYHHYSSISGTLINAYNGVCVGDCEAPKPGEFQSMYPRQFHFKFNLNMFEYYELKKELEKEKNTSETINFETCFRGTNICY